MLIINVIVMWSMHDIFLLCMENCIISHIRKFHVTEIGLVPTVSDMRGCTVIIIIISQLIDKPYDSEVVDSQHKDTPIQSNTQSEETESNGSHQVAAHATQNSGIYIYNLLLVFLML